MRNQGIEVAMISAQGKEIREVSQNEGVSHTVVPFTREISPLKDLYCLLLLILNFLKEKPDIVHTHTPKAGLLGMIAAKIARVPLRIHTIAGLPLMTATSWKKQLLVFTEKLTYWGAQYVLPNSESMRSYMIDQKLCDQHKMDMIGYGSTNGIDLSRFDSKVLSADRLIETKALIKYDKQYTYVLAVGRVVRDKGIIELIDAFIDLQSQMSDLGLKLIVLGPKEEVRNEELLPQNISDLLSQHKDITHIHWSVHVEYFMSLADVLVHASHREGFPNVLLQAGAVECPIVCSNIPGNIDIVRHQETGVLFEKGNKDDLISKLKYALEHTDETKEYAVFLRKEIEQKYERVFMHEEYLRFYKEKLYESVQDI